MKLQMRPRRLMDLTQRHLCHIAEGKVLQLFYARLGPKPTLRADMYINTKHNELGMKADIKDET